MGAIISIFIVGLLCNKSSEFIFVLKLLEFRNYYISNNLQCRLTKKNHNLKPKIHQNQWGKCQ